MAKKVNLGVLDLGCGLTHYSDYGVELVSFAKRWS
jgi:hypothetical protein